MEVMTRATEIATHTAAEVESALREAAELGPRAKAILHSRAIAAEDLKAAGGAFTLAEVCQLRGGISRQAIYKAVQEKRILAVGPERTPRRFPVAQFNDNGELVEGLRDVYLALDTDNGFAVLNFLMRARGDLDNRRPIDLLRNGDIAPVLTLAMSIGDSDL